MTCKEALEEYLKYLHSDRKSDNTIKNDKATLIKFFDALDYKFVADIKSNTAYEYRLLLEERGVGGTSSNIYMNRIKMFLKFLYEFHYIDTDIGANIKLLKQDKAKRQRGKFQFCDELEEPGRAMTLDEIKNIMKSVNVMYRDQPKYPLMIETLLICGFRITQLLTLKYKNIDFNTGIIRIINQKKSRLHEFYLGDKELLQKIMRYCYQNDITKPDDLVFPSDKDRNCPISYNTFRGIFKKIFYYAGLEYGKAKGGFTTHDFRRTCATVLDAAGMPITYIQDRLDHRGIKTTRKYIKKSITPERQAQIDGFVSKGFHTGGI